MMSGKATQDETGPLRRSPERGLARKGHGPWKNDASTFLGNAIIEAPLVGVLGDSQNVLLLFKPHLRKFSVFRITHIQFNAVLAVLLVLQSCLAIGELLNFTVALTELLEAE